MYTAKVFMLSEAKGIELKYITQYNSEIIDTLSVNSNDLQEIREAISAGKTVILPEKTAPSTIGLALDTSYKMIRLVNYLLGLLTA